MSIKGGSISNPWVLSNTYEAYLDMSVSGLGFNNKDIHQDKYAQLRSAELAQESANREHALQKDFPGKFIELSTAQQLPKNVEENNQFLNVLNSIGVFDSVSDESHSTKLAQHSGDYIPEDIEDAKEENSVATVTTITSIGNIISSKSKSKRRYKLFLKKRFYDTNLNMLRWLLLMYTLYYRQNEN